MKKKSLNLNRKLFLNKSAIVELTASQKQFHLGGDGPVLNSNTDSCTSIIPPGQTAAGSMCNPQFTNQCQTRAGQLGCLTANPAVCV